MLGDWRSGPVPGLITHPSAYAGNGMTTKVNETTPKSSACTAPTTPIANPTLELVGGRILIVTTADVVSTRANIGTP